MSESIPYQDQNIEKQEIWNNTLDRLRHVTDGLGLPIEESIIEAVAAMNVNSIPTNSSCGGHLEDEGLNFPYLQGSPADQPKYRYMGEEKIRQDFLNKNNIVNFRDIFMDEELENQYRDLIDDLGETEEYKNWYKNCSVLVAQVEKLIDEFKVLSGSGKLRLSPVYAHYRIVAHEVSDIDFENLEGVKEKIVLAQEEFNKFTEFLKDRFFNH